MTIAARLYPHYAYLRSLGTSPMRALAAVRNGRTAQWNRNPLPASRFGLGTQALRLQAAYDHYNTLSAAMRNHGMQRSARLRWWCCYQQARNPWGATH